MSDDAPAKVGGNAVVDEGVVEGVVEVVVVAAVVVEYSDVPVGCVPP